MIPLYSLRIEAHANSEFKKPLFFEGPHSLLPLLKKELNGVDREHGGIVMIDTNSRVIGLTVLSIGSLTRTIAEPREVIKTALALNADGIIKWHTHPTDNPEPSDSDRHSHEKLSEACKAVGLNYIDNVILSRDGNLFSFTNEKAMNEITQNRNRREKKVISARRRVDSGRGSSKDALLVCERDYQEQVCKYDFPRDLRVDTGLMIIDRLTPVAGSKRVKRSTRHKAKILLAVVKETLPIIQAGDEPPTVRVD